MFFLFVIMLFINNTYAEELVEAEIISRNKALQEGKNQIAVLFKIKEGWHIYWRNPGDSGLPTEFEWVLPENVSISEPHFPAPKKIPFSDMANYGYENEVLILFDLFIDAHYNSNILNLKSNIKWLVCKEKCLAGSSEEQVAFKIADNSEKNSYYDLFDNYINKIPLAKETNATANLQKNSIFFNTNDFENIVDAEFYPYQSGVFVHGAEQNFKSDKNGFSLQLKLDKFRVEEPESLHGLLEIKKDSQINYYEINVPLIEKD
jgi:DsbC/DsbD-like thiol-disulfide interchange protein